MRSFVLVSLLLINSVVSQSPSPTPFYNAYDFLNIAYSDLPAYSKMTISFIVGSSITQYNSSLMSNAFLTNLTQTLTSSLSSFLQTQYNPLGANIDYTSDPAAKAFLGISNPPNPLQPGVFFFDSYTMTVLYNFMGPYQSVATMAACINVNADYLLQSYFAPAMAPALSVYLKVSAVGGNTITPDALSVNTYRADNNVPIAVVAPIATPVVQSSSSSGLSLTATLCLAIILPIAVIVMCVGCTFYIIKKKKEVDEENARIIMQMKERAMSKQQGLPMVVAGEEDEESSSPVVNPMHEAAKTVDSVA
jgi:hypothetical protein